MTNPERFVCLCQVFMSTAQKKAEAAVQQKDGEFKTLQFPGDNNKPASPPGGLKKQETVNLGPILISVKQLKARLGIKDAAAEPTPRKTEEAKPDEKQSILKKDEPAKEEGTTKKNVHFEKEEVPAQENKEAEAARVND
jgi:hypothetical protein